MHQRRASYGIDAPGVVRNFALIALAGIALGLLVTLDVLPAGLVALASTMTLMGTGSAVAMIFGSKVLKLRLRDRLLDELKLRGTERVLDVGCGRGLLLIGAAKRLPAGKAIGVDLWQTVDQSGNAAQTTLANASAEGVTERIELHTADMRALPLADASVDVVVSSWAIHNVPDEAGRRQAIRELWRVLKPGGRFTCVDIQCTHEYLDELRRLGATDARLGEYSFLFLIPSRVLRATRAA